MNKIIPFVKKNFFIILLFLLIIPSFVSVIRPGFYSMHDDLQAFRIHQMDKCIQDLQIPCRWIPDMGFEYGYPQFNFYPPSIYYLGEIFHLIGFQFIDTVKILVILGFVTSALAMYLFLKDWLGRIAAIAGAFLYTYAPYKAVNPYVRGALSEFWALTFYPLIFWSIYQVVKTGKLKYILFLSLSSAGLLITHNLMPIIFAPLAIVWTVLLIVLEKKYKVIPKLLGAGLLALGLGSFFLLPVLFERGFVHVESILGGYFDYRQHFVNLEQLFISNYWGYGSSMWREFDGLSLSTGQLHWIIGLIGVLLAVVHFRKYPKLSVIALALGFLELLILFMMHSKSSFIWSKIGFLEYLQFPWRFLSDSIFLLSILSAIAIFLIEKTEFKIRRINVVWGVLGLIAVGIFILHGSFFKPHAWSEITDQEKFSGKSWDKQLTISIFDYLPIYAKLPPISKAPDKPEVLEGESEIVQWYKGSNWQSGQIKVQKESLIRLPLFYFPGMEVRANNLKPDIIYDECRGQEFCLGLISFKLPEGDYQVSAKLNDTPIRTVGNLLTVFSLAVVGFFTYQLIGRKHPKKNNRK